MKPRTSHYEILLFTGTSFANQEFSSLEKKNTDRNLTPVENLEKACWDGLLFEMLPELTGLSNADRHAVIWHVLTGKQYIYITIGTAPTIPDNEYSIDPYCFSMTACEN